MKHYPQPMGKLIGELSKLPGIGPKTAQRLILELKSKIDDLAADSYLENIESTHDEELYEALTNLGYSGREIDRAVSKADYDSEAELEEKIKQILSLIGKESF